MTPQYDVDSDDEDSLNGTSSVLLGVPDGEIDLESDLMDPMVSRLGGKPTFLGGISMSPDASRCKCCSNLMQLIIQLWCPLENSEWDRVLYVWACSRAACQRKDGSVRAFRTVRFNVKYANELAAKKAAVAVQIKPTPVSNPFALPSGGGPQGPFGITTFDELVSVEAHSENNNSSEERALQDAMAQLDLGPSVTWNEVPQYRPVYLATVNEPTPPASVSRKNANEAANASAEETNDASGWKMELYENSLTLDSLFERFAHRISLEPEQCVRYELGGEPLSYQADEIFGRLFPRSSQQTVTVTGSAFVVSATPARQYSTSTIPTCGNCGEKRIFECQLTPHVLSVIRKPQIASPRHQSEDERQQEIERLLKGSKGGSVAPSDSVEMEWGTCMIFSCAKDCAGVKEEKTYWQEEIVLAQWEST